MGNEVNERLQTRTEAAAPYRPDSTTMRPTATNEVAKNLTWQHVYTAMDFADSTGSGGLRICVTLIRCSRSHTIPFVNRSLCSTSDSPNGATSDMRSSA